MSGNTHAEFNRSKAIEAVKRGEKKIDVSRFFQISRNTLDLWLKKYWETGDSQANLPVGVGTPPKIKDLGKFQEFVTEHSDLTQKQMAELWGDDATQQNISYACRKLGITRKKKTYGYSERDEEKRCSAVLGRGCVRRRASAPWKPRGFPHSLLHQDKEKNLSKN